MVAALHDESRKFAADGAETVGNSPEEFARIMTLEMEAPNTFRIPISWGKVVKAAGIKPR